MLLLASLCLPLFCTPCLLACVWARSFVCVASKHVSASVCHPCCLLHCVTSTPHTNTQRACLLPFFLFFFFFFFSCPLPLSHSFPHTCTHTLCISLSRPLCLSSAGAMGSPHSLLLPLTCPPRQPGDGSVTRLLIEVGTSCACAPCTGLCDVLTLLCAYVALLLHTHTQTLTLCLLLLYHALTCSYTLTHTETHSLCLSSARAPGNTRTLCLSLHHQGNQPMDPRHITWLR